MIIKLYKRRGDLMNGMKLNFKKRGVKYFIVFSAVSTQLLGGTQIFAHNNSMGNESILETSQLAPNSMPVSRMAPKRIL